MFSIIAIFKIPFEKNKSFTILMYVVVQPNKVVFSLLGVKSDLEKLQGYTVVPVISHKFYIFL